MNITRNILQEIKNQPNNSIIIGYEMCKYLRALENTEIIATINNEPWKEYWEKVRSINPVSKWEMKYNLGGGVTRLEFKKAAF